MRSLLDDLGASLKSGLTQARFEADKAMRVGKAQREVETIEGELKARFEEMGRLAFQLLEAGQMNSPPLAAMCAPINELKAVLDAKESELALVKAQKFEDTASSIQVSSLQGKPCPGCGSLGPADASFCPACGRRLN